MERFYVRIYYLKVLHYFFFSLAVFSITAGTIFFDFVAWDTFYFFGFGYFYFLSSLAVAYYYYRNYREALHAIKIVRLYLIPYTVLVFWTVGFTSLLVLIFPSLLLLVESFLFIDYYVFFVIAIGLVLSRFRVVSKFFEMYNIYVLTEALKIVKQYAHFVDVSGYSVGSNTQMDEILDDIWTHMDYPLPYIRKFEIAVCEKHIIDMNRMISKMLDRGADETEKRIITYLEKMKSDYLKKISKIQEKVD